MSDTKNHKLAIKAIIEAHRTPGKMREIMLTILADKPSAIVNAWEEIKRDDFYSMPIYKRCLDCKQPVGLIVTRKMCAKCTPLTKQSESP